MQKDYYKILDIPHDASDAELKRAFRNKAKEYHPELNSASDAEDNFMLLNEAYEILIHRKTRKHFEISLTAFYNPEHEASYVHWLNVARERAAIHSRLPYSEFVKTKFYHSTSTSPYLLYMVEFIASIILISVPYFLMISGDQKLLGVASLFVALPSGIFLLVQASTGFSMMKKFKRETKRGKKELKKA